MGIPGITTEKGESHMQEKVEAFLRKCQNAKNAETVSYRYKVLEYAGLLTDKMEFVEVTKAEYEDALKEQQGTNYGNDGKFYVFKKVPVEVSDEEFAAVEKEIPEKVLEKLKKKTASDKKEKNKAVLIFMILACVMWAGGLILAISTSVTATNVFYDSFRQYDFSFSVFLSTLLSYVPYGAVFFFLAVLCRRFGMDIRRTDVGK